MRLLLDLGNSAIKWAVVPPGGAAWQTGRLAYADGAGPEDTAAALGGRIPSTVAPARICVASVLAPAWQRRFDTALERAWGGPVQHLVASAAAAGVTNGYDQPEQLGVDRWAALIGARAVAPEGACIVDVGTAITVDGLDADGRHLGGAIFPGARLLHQALARGTARLPDSPIGAAALPARSTEEGIAAGVAVGAGAAVTALADAILAACPPGAQRLITGGGGGELAAGLSPAWCHRPYLVLEGLLHWSRHEARR
ncbi:type III pantothenate kinase [Halorhodospira halophila]|uniref:Type III pantothenate kinase n=1 Tax=Halorhodospira halophila (strain DSM 244 / SL1) TaxID=349124 RepID=COAX_HALHL|nr:type III pantothenate kinase [Halorhodospira halophila]A1WVD8.1 RecName: Full=Type III pantothenate kinase; AltName: Full=PanK-III; AltName: Full=Pantothenic acid kinase [Halorhodospira halophila SL1]ABM61650.1 putative transcriptional acitvator, Baf family [Halorhodospira halophila SL1]MBK1729892.1 type III pantothenate kinase [Halorhodospira halophila]